jgi:ATP-dependent DNA helicase RecG
MHAYESNILKPHFELTENAIVTHLPVLTTKVLMSDDEKFIYQLIKDYGQLSSAELVSLTDFTKSKCLRLLKKLQDKDYVRVQGKGKGTRYTT